MAEAKHVVFSKRIFNSSYNVPVSHSFADTISINSLLPVLSSSDTYEHNVFNNSNTTL